MSSTFVADNWSDIKKRRKIKLQRIFPGKTKQQGVNVQLFFAKLFGCRIIDEKMPIAIDSFSHSVRSGTPHPELYLTFTMAMFSSRLSGYAAWSEVQALEKGGVCCLASWYYTRGSVPQRNGLCRSMNL